MNNGKVLVSYMKMSDKKGLKWLFPDQAEIQSTKFDQILLQHINVSYLLTAMIRCEVTSETFQKIKKLFKNLKNEILNNYILSVYSTLSFQVIFGKLIVNMIVIEAINETIIYLYSQIISIELKMIILNFSPLDLVIKYYKSDFKHISI